MNMYARDLKVCMEAMELAFERMYWDYVGAFQREGMGLKDIPDDLHEAMRAKENCLDYLHNCNELLENVEKDNMKKRAKERKEKLLAEMERRKAKNQN